MEKDCDTCVHSYEIPNGKCKFCLNYSNWETAFTDVTKPEHYHKGGIDVLGFAETKFPKEELKGFYRINILKYITRYDLKNGVEDLVKAKDYMDRLIKLEGEGDGNK